MTNRRKFITNTGTLALGSLLVPYTIQGTVFRDNVSIPAIGIQTYTVDPFIRKNPKAVFQKLAEIGFRNIETASYKGGPYHGYKPAELKTLIEDLGMKWIGHHVLGVPMNRLLPLPNNPTPEQLKMAEEMKKMAVPNLAENMQQLVDEAAEVGLQYLICATTVIKTMDDIQSAVDTFSKTGEACKKAGLQFAYHNHDTEWDIVDGKTAYDVILSQTDKNLVKMELDLGWVASAKKDPVKLFKGNPGRFPLWHVKDIDLTTNTVVPIGTGTVDFKPAFTHAKIAGMKYFFYEQDEAQSMDDVILSYNNLKKIL